MKRWIAMLALLCYAQPQHAIAQTAPDYPSKPVRIIVPYTPGGLVDTFARALAEHLAGAWGKPVLVENRPGATQIIGAEAAAKAAPDGHTLFVGTQTSLVMNAIVNKTLPYDPLRDFTPVSGLFVTPFYLVVNKNVPANSLGELIALARSQPGKLTYASLGQGGSHHLAGEMFKKAAGVDILHVPYKGSAPAISDLLGGQVDMMFEGGASALPYVKEGRLKAMATTTAERTEAMPELPTMGETLKGYEVSVWMGLVAPAGTPRPIIDQINREVGAMLRSPKTHQSFITTGIAMMPTTPEQLGERIRAERPQWKKLLDDVGIETF